MKTLFIGGTGTISMAISKLLLEQGWELYLINRGNRNKDPRLKGAHFITVDINDEATAAKKLEGMTFDVACDFIGFVPSQLERDYRLLKGKVRQFMFIMTAVHSKEPLLSLISNISDNFSSIVSGLAKAYSDYRLTVVHKESSVNQPEKKCHYAY